MEIAIINDGRFKPGHVPANKGQKIDAETYAKCEPTMFKKGHSPANTLEDGTITVRTSKTGIQYKYIRISSGNWMMLQHYNWIKKYGPIPKGLILACKNTNQLNCDPSNWELITRAENAIRNQNREKAAESMKKTWEIKRKTAWTDLSKERKMEKERHRRAVKLRKSREKAIKNNRVSLEKKKVHNLTCIVCNNTFQSKYKTTKYCSRSCWNNYNRLKAKGYKKPEAIRKASKAGNADKMELQQERKRKAAIKASPDLSQLIPVRIDPKTIIFIKPGGDPEKARNNFIHKYSEAI